MAVTTDDAGPAAGAGPTGIAVALRAVTPELTELTDAERTLLAEWMGGWPRPTHVNVDNRKLFPSSELGLDAWDGVNVLRAGGDYGWPGAEGPDGDGGTRPLFWLAPREASPSGIAYAGDALWMAGLRGQRLWRLPVADGGRTGAPVAYLAEEYGRLRTVEVAPDGALWVTTSNTDQATLGGADTRGGDDRILRIELVPAR